MAAQRSCTEGTVSANFSLVAMDGRWIDGAPFHRTPLCAGERNSPPESAKRRMTKLAEGEIPRKHLQEDFLRVRGRGEAYKLRLRVSEIMISESRWSSTRRRGERSEACGRCRFCGKRKGAKRRDGRLSVAGRNGERRQRFPQNLGKRFAFPTSVHRPLLLPIHNKEDKEEAFH